MVTEPTVSAPGNYFHNKTDIPTIFPTLPPCGEALSLEIEKYYRMRNREIQRMGLAGSKRFLFVRRSKHTAPGSLLFFGGGWGDPGQGKGGVDRGHTWWLAPNIIGHAVLSGD